MIFTITYEDDDVLVVDKPAGIVVFPEGQTKDGTLIEELVAQYPELAGVGEGPRYGVVHRLDKDTSGVLLVAKRQEALIFFQKQFTNRRVEKIYQCLVEGRLKEEKGVINALLARSTSDPRKQTVYRSAERAPASAREAITEYQVVEQYKDFSLLDVEIKTGRKHQIRAHLAYLQHPIVGDKLYRFKNSPVIEGLDRQFLHAKYLKIEMPSGEEKAFASPLPPDLKKVLDTIER